MIRPRSVVAQAGMLLMVVLPATLLAQGIVAPALSLHAIGTRHQPWRGFLLGYAQVPVEQIPGLVTKLADALRNRSSG